MGALSVRGRCMLAFVDVAGVVAAGYSRYGWKPAAEKLGGSSLVAHSSWIIVAGAGRFDPGRSS